MLRFTRHLIVLMAMTGLLALVVAACGDGDNNDAPITTPEVSDGFPVTLTGSDGQELTFTSPPQRIVSLSAGHSEILFAIGAGDQVVAVDLFSDYPPEAASVALRLDSFEPSVEAIAAVEPDLVILFFTPEGLMDQLRGLGIPVFFDDLKTEVTSIEALFESIVKLARATGHTAEAEELVAGLRARVDAVVEAVEDVERGPTVYLELDEFLFTISPDSFVGDLYRTLKAENIVRADEGGFPSLNQEAIIERNPEVIVLADAEFGQTPEVVSARPGWDTISAVANGRVYIIDPDIVSRPGPRIIDALEELARLLYPELFATQGRYQCSVCFADAA